MKKLLTQITTLAITLILVISCNSTRDYKRDIDPALIEIDNLLIYNKEKTRAAISNIATDSLSKKNLNYYNLLNNITTKLYLENKASDTIIKPTYNYYKELYLKDSSNSFIRYNYARSMLYLSLVKYNNDVNDSLTHSLQANASKLLAREKYPNYYHAIANSFLAATYYHYKDLTRSEEYYAKVFQEFKDLNMPRVLVLVKLDRVLNFLISRRYDKVYEGLEEIREYIPKLDDTIKCSYNIALATYYATQRSTDLAINTAKECKEINIDDIVELDNSKLYFALSKYYSYLDDVENAIIYANKAIECVKKRNNTPDRIHNFYRNIGDIYSKHRDYYKSTYAYKNAFYFTINSILNYHERVQKAAEKEFRESMDLSDEKRERAEMVTIFLIITIVILTLLFFIVFLNQKNKASKEILASKVKELQTSRAITEIASLDILPNFLDRINVIYSSKFKDVDELISYLDTTLSDAKKETHARMLELINNDAFTSMHPLFKYKSSFSNQENIIIFLLMQKLTVKQISGLINITQSSIRGGKAKIKQKIASLDIPYEEKDNLLKGL